MPRKEHLRRRGLLSEWVDLAEGPEWKLITSKGGTKLARLILKFITDDMSNVTATLTVICARAAVGISDSIIEASWIALTDGIDLFMQRRKG